MSEARVSVPSTVGSWILEGDNDGITRIYLSRRRISTPSPKTPRTLVHAAKQLDEYLARRRRHFDVDLHVTGTDFQRDVWLAFTDIPYGDVRSYGDIAAIIGRPLAHRAVGTAAKNNPYAIIVPCHRVVAARDIGGYGSGLDVKRFLLAVEGVTNL